MNVHGWTHTICQFCYHQIESGRESVRVPNAPTQRCCFCGTNTNDGIFYRARPNQNFCPKES